MQVQSLTVGRQPTVSTTVDLHESSMQRYCFFYNRKVETIGKNLHSWVIQQLPDIAHHVLMLNTNYHGVFYIDSKKEELASRCCDIEK